jgi:cytochrome c oxidase subunit 2
VMLVVATIVYLIVLATTIWVVRRRNAFREDTVAAREQSAAHVVKWAVAVTAAILLVTVVYDFSVASGMMPHSPPALSIRVTGHQWWWEIEYEDTLPSNRFKVANEIHIPVGQPVLVKLDAADVIHSFWIPNLNGKKDLIPGHYNETWLRADRPGIYRGQCAEFCGAEHAKMVIFVVADPPAKFAAWLAHQRLPAALPTDSITARGQFVFESGTCASCHTIASTRANGHLGPNLTHLASRSTIASGTLKNSRGNLSGWILDPQTLKPGAKMPANELSASDLHALVAYLETLH